MPDGRLFPPHYWRSAIRTTPPPPPLTGGRLMAGETNATLVLGFKNLSPACGLAYSIIRLIQGTIAVVVNGVTLFALARYHAMLSRSALLLASLAVADINSIWGTILASVFYWGSIGENEAITHGLCILKESVNLIYMSVNAMTILWIAVDRFIYVWYPTKYRQVVTLDRFKVLIALTYAYVIVTVLFGFAAVSTYKPGVLCVFPNPKLMPQAYFFGIIISHFLLFSSLTLGLYVLIGHLACRKAHATKKARRRVDQSACSTHGQAEDDQREQRITRTLSLILGFYFVCYVPMIVTANFVDTHSSPPLAVFYLFTITWFHMNTCANPFVYAWGSKNFQKALGKVVDDLKRCIMPCARRNKIDVITLQ